MSSQWPNASLDELCVFRNGLWKGEKPPYETVGVIRNTNFTKSGGLDRSEIMYLDVETSKYRDRKLEFGDIVLEKSGGGPKQPVGRVALFDLRAGEFSFSNFTAAIRVRDHSRLDFRFLHKFLYWIYLSGVTEGMQTNSTGIRNLDGNAFKAIRVPVPLLAEQQRIVCILDEAFASIAIAKANIETNVQNARGLFNSVLGTLIEHRKEGWVQKRLAEISTVFGRGRSRHRPRNDAKLYGGRYPFIQTGDIRNASHQISCYSQTYNQAGLEQSKLWPAGTVCITIAANIAETAILGFDACFPDSVIGVVTEPTSTDNKFLEYLLQSYKIHLQSLGKGSAQMNINLGTFEEQTFPFPPLPIQHSTVKALDEIRKHVGHLESLYFRQSNLLEALKNSLLSGIFRTNL